MEKEMERHQRVSELVMERAKEIESVKQNLESKKIRN